MPQVRLSLQQTMFVIRDLLAVFPAPRDYQAQYAGGIQDMEAELRTMENRFRRVLTR